MTQINTELVTGISHSFELILPASVSAEELKEKLASHINYLLNHDFEKLVFYLYRIDVDENKLRQLLQARQGENAAGLIADLVIERQLQKTETRKQFGGGQSSDEEKW